MIKLQYSRIKNGSPCEYTIWVDFDFYSYLDDGKVDLYTGSKRFITEGYSENLPEEIQKEIRLEFEERYGFDPVSPTMATDSQYKLIQERC